MRPDQTEHFPPVKPDPRRDIQAFPCQQGHTPDGEWNQSFDPGMTLRDYFAAKAMQSFVIDTMPDKCAELAYEYADAMLKAREDGI